MASLAAAAPSEAPAEPPRRVLSVQSHVVHGYVGNKSAVFPLQLLGFDVDFVNSVQFSNHTGYSKFTGQVLQGDQLQALVDGLDHNALLAGYSHLLTGYIGSVSFLRAVCAVFAKLKTQNPGLVYVCDPVLGDAGKLYVPQELVDIYRQEVLPLASVLTPNQFECELLCRRTIATEADAIAACAWFHARGPRTVVITSIDQRDDPDTILMMASQQQQGQGEDGAGGDAVMYRLAIPRIPGRFTGTGDLTAALLLAWLREHGNDLAVAMEKVATTLHRVIGRTVADGSGELRLIQSKTDIEQPALGALTAERIPLDRVQQGQQLLARWVAEGEGEAEAAAS